MSDQAIVPKKLIEVALPLSAINSASVREKNIRHGHPSTLHLWWARRPLSTVRAVIFGQLVNDPSWKWELENPGQTPPNHLKATWAKSRKRLFSIVEELVAWKNTTNEDLLTKARAEIHKSWRETCELNKEHPRAAELFNVDALPALHDPFAGGGAIPLEAQRLGLRVAASDLNPIAVLLNKALIEIPPKFRNSEPVGPVYERSKAKRLNLKTTWPGSSGLAEDVRRYGELMRDQALERIGHLYPDVEVTEEILSEQPNLARLAGKTLTVIAWLWARTVRSPNPAFQHAAVPLVSTFVLSSKSGNQAYVEPVLDGDAYNFSVKSGPPPETAKEGTKVPGRGADFRCLLSGALISGTYIKAEGKAGRLGARLIGAVAEGQPGRVYLSPTPAMESAALSAAPNWKPAGELPRRLTGGSCVPYGLNEWCDLFTARQLVALETISECAERMGTRIRQDALQAGMSDDESSLSQDGEGATAYAEAVSVYLALSVDKASDYWSSLCSWHSSKELIRNTFGRQALPMVWDYAEANPFSNSSGNILSGITWAEKVLNALPEIGGGESSQADAQTQSLSSGKFVSTDPPYYDNIAYADLSDYFYVWLRRSLRSVYPDLFATMSVPKADELVATAYRHGGKESAEAFFLSGMTKAMDRLACQAHPGAPLTIYYAFKQSETKGEAGTVSTGWETFLEAVQRSGLALTGTWPMRTELPNKVSGIGRNMLASSVVLVCRSRDEDSPTISRRDFIRELNKVLPEALDEMTQGAGVDFSPVAPVDLSQAIIGPGMAVFTKYSAVLEADGSPMSVRTALSLINRFLADEDFDPDTQFCLHWFQQFGWSPGDFGEADVLARAKGTSVDGVQEAGVLEAVSGTVKLLRWVDYSVDWSPEDDLRLPVWEVLHRLIQSFRTLGETGAAEVHASVRPLAEQARQLAYRLYTLCERRDWADDARAYNELIAGWDAIEALAQNAKTSEQGDLFLEQGRNR